MTNISEFTTEGKTVSLLKRAVRRNIDTGYILDLINSPDPPGPHDARWSESSLCYLMWKFITELDCGLPVWDDDDETEDRS
jgi:hypothetical protein